MQAADGDSYASMTLLVSPIGGTLAQQAAAPNPSREPPAYGRRAPQIER
jgi:hypothetical protein